MTLYFLSAVDNSSEVRDSLLLLGLYLSDHLAVLPLSELWVVFSVPNLLYLIYTLIIIEEHKISFVIEICKKI